MRRHIQSSTQAIEFNVQCNITIKTHLIKRFVKQEKRLWLQGLTITFISGITGIRIPLYIFTEPVPLRTQGMLRIGLELYSQLGVVDELKVEQVLGLCRYHSWGPKHWMDNTLNISHIVFKSFRRIIDFANSSIYLDCLIF